MKPLKPESTLSAIQKKRESLELALLDIETDLLTVLFISYIT